MSRPLISRRLVELRKDLGPLINEGGQVALLARVLVALIEYVDETLEKSLTR